MYNSLEKNENIYLRTEDKTKSELEFAIMVYYFGYSDFYI